MEELIISLSCALHNDINEKLQTKLCVIQESEGDWDAAFVTKYQVRQKYVISAVALALDKPISSNSVHLLLGGLMSQLHLLRILLGWGFPNGFCQKPTFHLLVLHRSKNHLFPRLQTKPVALRFQKPHPRLHIRVRVRILH